MPRRKKLPPVVHDEPSGPDYINNLNNDCLGRVFQFLPLEDRFRIRMVCKRWNKVSDLAWENTKSLSFGSRYSNNMLETLPPQTRTKKGVQKLLNKYGHHLESLFLSKFQGLLRVVSEHCQNLTTLEMDCAYEDWRVFKPFFPKLESLTISGLRTKDRRIPEEVFHALPQHILKRIHLQCLNSNFRKALLPDSTPSILQNFKQLEAIGFDMFCISSNMMSVIFQIPTLKFLSFQFCSLLTPFTSPERRVPDLVSDPRLIEIAKTCPELRTLRFTSDDVTDRGVSSLSSLTKLQTLQILAIDNSILTDTSLSGLHSLKVLECDGFSNICNDGIINLLRHASNLEEIHLICTGVTQRLLNEANKIMKQRTNNVGLTLYVSDDVLENWVVDEKSPLLTVLDWSGDVAKMLDS